MSAIQEAMQSDYYYSFGRIKALETKLIPKARMGELARARSVQEVLAHLEETEYTHYLSQARTIEDFEGELSEAVERAYALCGRISPETWVVEIFRIRREFECYKRDMRADRKLPEEIGRLIEGKNLFETDLTLDREMFSRILGMSKDEEIKTLIRKEIDLQNLLALERARENGEKFAAFIEGGNLPDEPLSETEYPSLLNAKTHAEREKSCRDFLLDEAKKLAAEKMASPAVVFAYLLEKEKEVSGLSAIIKSKVMGLDWVPT